MIGTIPALTTTSIGINEFELHHFAIPVLNLFTILKELLFGIVQYDHILLVNSSGGDIDL